MYKYIYILYSWNLMAIHLFQWVFQWDDEPNLYDGNGWK